MSRHRNIRNMNYDDERDDDDYVLGRSFDDDGPIDAQSQQYLYRRRLPSSSLREGAHHSGDIQEEYYDDDGDDNYGAYDDMLDLDDVRGGGGAAARRPNSQTNQKPAKKPTPNSQAIQQMKKTPVTPRASQTKKGKAGPQTVQTPAGEKLLTAAVAELRVEESEGGSRPPSRNSSMHRLALLAQIQQEKVTKKESAEASSSQRAQKELLNLVVVGHVDAGKSTLMGHLLVQLGRVDQRQLHRYRTDAARMGKASFAFAWVLDETDAERERGITIDVATNYFETAHRRVVLLDAPGHKDFIPNMITGATQADAAVLVVNATRGEFESGFDQGGQTREHALLLRSLGVSQLIVAINQMDKVEWAQIRFDQIQQTVDSFLRKTGFSNVIFVAVSGMEGTNVSQRPDKSHALTKWYNGPSLCEAIDSLIPPNRSTDGPLRAVILDVQKASTSQLIATTRVESGTLNTGQRYWLMPHAQSATLKAISTGDSSLQNNSSDYNDDERVMSSSGVCTSLGAGEHALVTLAGDFENDSFSPGTVVVQGGPDTLLPGHLFRVRLVVFDVTMPLLPGTRFELFAHALCVSCTIRSLVSLNNRSNGEVTQRRPKCIPRNSAGVVEIETEFDIAIEPCTVSKALGRVTLRAFGQTVAAGVVEQRVE